jgi:hypothetical protein
MDQRAIWLAVCLGFYSGLPASTLNLREPKKENHCLRVKDATFVILNATSEVELRMKEGPLLAAYLKKSGDVC